MKINLTYFPSFTWSLSQSSCHCQRLPVALQGAAVWYGTFADSKTYILPGAFPRKRVWVMSEDVDDTIGQVGNLLKTPKLFLMYESLISLAVAVAGR